MPYRFFDHEADVGIEVEEQTLEGLYQDSMEALFSLIIDPKAIEERVERDIVVEDGEGLLVFFLNDLLFLFDAYLFIPKRALLQIGEGGLKGRLFGDLFDEKRHEVRKVAKAVTFHGFSLERDGQLWRARFIIDV